MFFGCQIERLLPYTTSEVFVFGGKTAVIFHPQLIIGLAECETQDEVGGVETEQAIIVYPVDASCRFFVTDSRVPEERIDLFTRSACQQADPDGISGGQIFRYPCQNRED